MAPRLKGRVLTWASKTFTATAQADAHAHGTVVVAGALSATPEPDLLNNAAVSTLRLG